MELPPISFLDISLILIIDSIVLLLTLEFLSPSYGLTNVIINKRRLYYSTLITLLSFLLVISIRIIGVIIGF